MTLCGEYGTLTCDDEAETHKTEKIESHRCYTELQIQRSAISISHASVSGHAVSSREVEMRRFFALLLVFAASCRSEFNYTKSPAPWELQSDAARSNFSLSKFAGTYYELALHDYTQHPACPSPTSHKVVDYGEKIVNDTFVLNCLGKNYTSHFHFHSSGKVSGLPVITFPDTVVDYIQGTKRCV